MDLKVCYEVNSPYVIFETVEQETFVVDYSTGYYFALDQAGTWIWNLLAKGPISLEMIYKKLDQLGAVANKEKKMISEFYQELAAANLIVESADQKALFPEDQHDITGLDWSAIRLDKFTDMKMLIRLDPVHEIDGRGWPREIDGVS